MAITYDYTNKLVNVPQADAQPLTIQNLLNDIRAQEASVRGIVEPIICSAAGKDDLGGSVAVGITLALQSTWKLNFATGAYQATVGGGNLADALNRVYNTGSPQVLFLSSAAGTLTTQNTGSGLSATQDTRLADMWRRLALDAASPVTHSTGGITFGGITIQHTEAGGNVTEQRQ